MPTQLFILHVEDDQDDVDFFQQAFADNGVSIISEVINEGDKVLPWLKQGNKLPDMIVMDLNLPKLHGKEILRNIKATEQFKDIPIVILTTSSSVEDRKCCLENGADAFITKPSSIEGFKSMVSEIVSVAEKAKAKH
jgi:DNA-binding response OmpR family regulator